MSDAITTFLDELGAAPQPLLSHVAGTIRIDLDNGGGTRHWLLDIRKGAVDVSDAGAATEADASMHTHRSVFERLITGEANAVATTLRGQLSMDGDVTLLVAFQRVMPGPPVAAAAGMSKTSPTSKTSQSSPTSKTSQSSPTSKTSQSSQKGN